MICTEKKEHEQNILLMLHGELNFRDTMRLKSHLSKCAACRKKQNSMLAVSSATAAAIRGTDLPKWTFKTIGRPSRLASIRLSTLLMVIIGSGALIAAGYYGVARANSKPSNVIPVSAAINKCPTCCVPDLKNDHCK